MRTKRTMLVLLCTAALLLCACVQAPQSGDLKMAFICPKQEDAYYQKMYDGLCEAMRPGDTLECYEVAGDYTSECAAAQRCARQGYDAIFLSSQELFNTSIFEIRQIDDEIAVIAIDMRYTDNPDQSIVMDQRQAGAAAMEALLEDVDEEDCVLVYGARMDEWGRVRLKGCRSVLKEHAQLETIYIDDIDTRLQRGENESMRVARMTQTAQETIAAALRENPQITAVWAMDAWMAQGAVRAVEELGLTGRVAVACAGVNAHIMYDLEQGRLQAVAAVPPHALGMAAMQAYYAPDIRRILFGNRECALPAVVMDASNLETDWDVDAS